MRALGYEFVMDYPVNTLGLQDQYGGSILVDGSWYCPSMPEPLIDATADHTAGLIDTDTLRRRVRERERYRVRPKEAADADGNRKYRCPGAGKARTIDCFLKPSDTGHPTKKLLPILVPKNPDRICTNKDSLSIPPTAGLKYRQDLPYQSAEWFAAYHGPRNTVEGVNRRLKSDAEQGLGSPEKRLARSVTAQSLFAVTAAVATNVTRVFKWLNNATETPKQDHGSPAPRTRAKRRTDTLTRYGLEPARGSPPPGGSPTSPTAA